MPCVDTVQGVDAAELEMVATGRAFRCAYLLTVRGRMHVSDLARRLDCTERHVYRIVANATLSRVPVTVTDGWVELWLDGRDY